MIIYWTIIYGNLVEKQGALALPVDPHFATLLGRHKQILQLCVFFSPEQKSRSRAFHTSISPVNSSIFFFISRQPLDWGVSHSDAWKWPKGMRQPWSMLHPIGDYRNCPSNNIFIASGWLNATLEILCPPPAPPPAPHVAATLCNHPLFRVSPNAASARKSTVE